MPGLTPEQREYAELLLEHATSDLGACRVLMAAEDMRDDVVGFHAQQAVEKALKVALVVADVDFPRSHDLRELVDIATDSDVTVPGSIEEARWLTPWAAQLRYRCWSPRSRCGLLNSIRRHRVGYSAARRLTGAFTLPVGARGEHLGSHKRETPMSGRSLVFGFIEPRTDENSRRRRVRDALQTEKPSLRL